MNDDQQSVPSTPLFPARPIHRHHHVHRLGQMYDDLGVFPLPGKQGQKGDKGDTGDVIGGYKVTMKGELERISDLDDIVDPMQGDIYFIKEDGFYRFRNGENWIMAVITSLPGKNGQGLETLAGGNPGDVLVKKSDTDYDFEWIAYKDLWKVVDEITNN